MSHPILRVAVGGEETNIIMSVLSPLTSWSGMLLIMFAEPGCSVRYKAEQEGPSDNNGEGLEASSSIMLPGDERKCRVWDGAECVSRAYL